MKAVVFVPALAALLVAVLRSPVAVEVRHNWVEAEMGADKVRADRVGVDMVGAARRQHKMAEIGVGVDVGIAGVAAQIQGLCSGQPAVVDMCIGRDRYHRTATTAANCTRNASGRRQSRADTRTDTLETLCPRLRICRTERNLLDHERSLRFDRVCLRRVSHEISWCEVWATD